MDNLHKQLLFTGCSLLCAGIGAVRDLRECRIPNRLTATALVAGLMMHWVAGGPREASEALLAGLIAGAIFLVFFVAGAMGAGDVKLMAAVGCICGLPQVYLVVVATAIAGGVFALVVSLHRGCARQVLHNASVLVDHHRRHGLKPQPDLNLANAHTLRLPFAFPIAAGCLFAVCARAWETYL